MTALILPGALAAQSQQGRGTPSVESRLRAENDSLRLLVSELQSRRVGTLLDQVVVRMERLEREPKSFFRARSKADLGLEEKRLTTLAQEQATEARSLVAELRGMSYAQADSLDGLVRGAATDYSTYVGILRLSVESSDSVSGGNPEADAKVAEYRKAFAGKLAAIRQLKQAQRGS